MPEEVVPPIGVTPCCACEPAAAVSWASGCLGATCIATSRSVGATVPPLTCGSVAGAVPDFGSVAESPFGSQHVPNGAQEKNSPSLYRSVNPGTNEASPEAFNAADVSASLRFTLAATHSSQSDGVEVRSRLDLPQNVDAIIR